MLAQQPDPLWIANFCGFALVLIGSFLLYLVMKGKL